MIYDALRDLPLTIERIETETLSHPISPEFTRKTTVIHLIGDGAEGIGEDVTYDPRQHEDQFPSSSSTGEWTIGSLSAHLDPIDMFPAGEPDQHAYRDYRRWAVRVRSARPRAAAAPAGRSGTRSAASTGRCASPPRRAPTGFPTGSRSIRRSASSRTRTRSGQTTSWRGSAGRGAIDVIDLKGQYKGTAVDTPPDAELYRRVAEGFPDAWIEDPALTDETDEVLLPHRDRVTWDAPIHSWADVEALPFAPKCLNVKPSRFGSLERLFEFYDRCAEQGIALYGGGQWELGPGRGQIQLLASLFSADGPNDTAPGGYNGEPRPGPRDEPARPAPRARRLPPRARR